MHATTEMNAEDIILNKTSTKQNYHMIPFVPYIQSSQTHRNRKQNVVARDQEKGEMESLTGMDWQFHKNDKSSAQ